MDKTILTAVIALTLLASATNLLAAPAAGSPPFQCNNSKIPCVVADCATQTVTAFGYWSYLGATWKFHASSSWQAQTYDKTGSGPVFADAYTFPEKGIGSVDVSGVLKASNLTVGHAEAHCEL